APPPTRAEHLRSLSQCELGEMAADEPGDPGDQHAHEGDFTPAAAGARRKRIRSGPGAEILERAGRRGTAGGATPGAEALRASARWAGRAGPASGTSACPATASA